MCENFRSIEKSSKRFALTDPLKNPPTKRVRVEQFKKSFTFKIFHSIFSIPKVFLRKFQQNSKDLPLSFCYRHTFSFFPQLKNSFSNKSILYSTLRFALSVHREIDLFYICVSIAIFACFTTVLKLACLHSSIFASTITFYSAG